MRITVTDFTSTEALWNPVLGGNLEDLHGDANQELDSVLGGNLDDLECQRAARRKKRTVGTSTNCSTSCGSRSGIRVGMFSKMILDTSITCSVTTNRNVAQNWRTSGNYSTSSGTGTSSIGTRTNASIIFSTVCPLCPLVGPWRLCQAGRPPPCGVFIVQLEEHRFPRHSGPRRAVRGLSGPCRLLSVGRACCSCLHTHSSLNSGGNAAEEWWKVSAWTVRTVSRSCFSHERSRRSRRLQGGTTVAFDISHMSAAEV